MQAFIKHEAFYDKKYQLLRKSRNAITSTCYKLKHFLNIVGFRLQTSAGLRSMSLKKSYQIKKYWVCKNGTEKSKSFIACHCDRSCQDNPYRMHKLRQNKGNIKLDDLHAKGRQSHFDKLFLDNDQNEPTPPNKR